MSVTLLIADDHEIIQEGIAALVESHDIKVVGVTKSGKQVVAMVKTLRPDVVLLDVRLAGENGLNALARIKQLRPEQNVLMFSAYDSPSYMAKAIALEANGYLMKSCPSQELIDGIKTVANGEFLWTRQSMRRITGALATPRVPSSVDVPLTMREAEVLKALTDGQTNGQIAQTLEISYETVKEHVQHILRKIGVETRTQAAVWALRHGLD